jgi:hypothetical protein
MAILTRETTATGVTNNGAPLTNAELDNNFVELQQNKVDVSGAIIFSAKAGEALSKGDVVYVSGISGNQPVVSKADANDAAKMPAFGLAEADASNNAAVNVVTFGTLYNLDTAAFAAGDTVFVSTTAGAITNTAPTGESSLLQNIGKVIRSHASAGSIKVGGAGRTNATPNLNDGNVFIGNASNQAETRALLEADISDFGTYLPTSGGTMTGALTLNSDPTANLQAATKQYVDTLAAASLHYHDPVRVEQEGNLTATYDNGTAGVGATLTNSGTQEALVIDGVTLSTSDRVLIYEQTDATQNGIYTVTDTGSGSTNWVLTRATDADSYGPSDPDSFGEGDAFFVLEGTLGAGELYVMNASGVITFGTTNITFAQVSSAQVYTAGTGISISGAEISTTALLNVVEDTTPQLGGTLNANGNSIDMGTYTITDAKVGQWDAAYGWGDHASAGYYVNGAVGFASTGIDDNATSTAITIDSSQNVSLSGDLTVDTNTLYVDSTNNQVGIGKTPTCALNVASDDYLKVVVEDVSGTNTPFSIGSGNNAFTIANNTSANTADEAITLNQISQSIICHTAGTERMRIDSSGNVGIGAAPTGASSYRTLNIVGPDANVGGALRLSTTDGSCGTVFNYNTTLYLYGQTSTLIGWGDPAVGGAKIAYRMDGSDGLHRWFDPSDGTTERMRIDSSGNVGIGTTDPQSILHIEGGSYTVSEDQGLTIVAGDSQAANYWKGGLKVGSDAGGTGELRLEAPTGPTGGSFVAYKLNNAGNGVHTWFNESGTEVLKIDSSGNVGIGVTPSFKVHVSGDDGMQHFIQGGTNLSTQSSYYVAQGRALFGYDAGKVLISDNGAIKPIVFETSGFERMRIEVGGDLGINITNPTEKLHVGGNILATGNVTAYSDERLKSDVETLDGSKVYEMRGVSFTKDGEAGSGVIAQELQKVAPELVNDSGEYLSVAYGNLVGYLIEAVKELKAEIEELKNGSSI